MNEEMVAHLNIAISESK